MAIDWPAERLPEDREAVRAAVSDLCSKYDLAYWLRMDDSGD